MDELLTIQKGLNWLNDNVERKEFIVDEYTNTMFIVLKQIQAYLFRFPNREEFRLWLADQNYHKDVYTAVTGHIGIGDVEPVRELLQRLHKAHELYEQADNHKQNNIKKLIYEKAEPIIQELEKFGADRAFCDLLLIFGGRFLTYEFPKNKQDNLPLDK